MTQKIRSTRRDVAITIVFVMMACIAAGSAALSFSSCSSCRGHEGPGSERKAILYYTCPMHPSYRSDKPGDCPICGMKLVPVKEEPQGKSEGQGGGAMQMPEQGPVAQAEKGKEARVPVTIESEQQQRIGVATAKVEAGPAETTIRAAGRVAFDPGLAVAQKEYIEARRVGDLEIADAARRRLTLLGMSKEQIDGLSGRSKPDANLVLPGRKAWVYASIYERELPLVSVGDSAQIEMPDGRPAGTGTVKGIDPVLDQQTRTSRARIEVSNAEGRFRPNMFVTAILHNDLGTRLLVPKSAVIDSGERKLVFVVHEGTHFMPREVMLGPELDKGYVVDSGLEAGETVATAALFLIDSESQLKAAAGEMAGHKHD